MGPLINNFYQYLLDTLNIVEKAWFLYIIFQKHWVFIKTFFFCFQLDALDNSMDIANALEEFTKSLLIKKTINKDNLKKFMDSYVNRTDITQDLSSDLLCDALLVVGSKSLICNSALELHSKMHKVISYINIVSDKRLSNFGFVIAKFPLKSSHSYHYLIIYF